eukprot:59001_1
MQTFIENYKMIIRNDGHVILIESIIQIEANCNEIKDTKLPLIGLCYHWCADEKKNITNIDLDTNVMVPPDPFIITNDVIFAHEIQWDDVVFIFHVKYVTCYMTQQKETFSEYVDRVYDEYFGAVNAENKEDTNNKRIVDGKIFFTQQNNIQSKERQDIFGTLILSDWYSTLSNSYRVKIRTFEKYLYLKYGMNKEIYCFHLSHIFWESHLISICEEFFKAQTNNDIDMTNDDTEQQDIKQKFSELFLNKEESISNLYNTLKDILKIELIDTSLSDEKYDAIQIKKFRSNNLLAYIRFDKREKVINYIKTSYSKDIHLQNFMLQKEELYYKLFKTCKNLYIYGISVSLVQCEMHKIYNDIIQDESADKLQILYLNYVQHNSLKVTQTIQQINSFLWPLESNTNNKRTFEETVEEFTEVHDPITSSPSNKKQKTDIKRKHFLEPNAYKLLKKLILEMPNESDTSYNVVMRETFVPKRVIQQMRNNLKKRGYLLNVQTKTETKIKYNYLSPR